jgi:hypothetical protein
MEMYFQLIHFTAVLFISAQQLGVLEVNWNSQGLVAGRCAKERHLGLQQNQYTIGKMWLRHSADTLDQPDDEPVGLSHYRYQCGNDVT